MCSSQQLMECAFWVVVLLYLWGCSVYSVVAPFYPPMALGKGRSEQFVGVLFSIYPLVGFISSPFHGFLMSKLGKKGVLLISIVIAAVGVLFFGLLPYFEGVGFVAMSFLTRILQGYGASGVFISTLAIVSSMYPSSIETKVGIVETFGSLGLILGPVIGGVLNEIGGYTFIFITYSAGFLLFGVLCSVYVPSDLRTEGLGGPRTLSVLSLMKSVEVNVALITVVFGMAGLTYFEPVLSNHLAEHVGIPPLAIAGMFALPMFGYALAIKVQSCVRKGLSREYLLSAGLLLLGTGYLFLCQQGVLGVNDNPIVIAGTLLVLGMGSALAYLPSLPYMISASKRRYGECNEEATSTTLSSMMGTSHYLGETVGPTLSGFFISLGGYEYGFLLFSAVLYSVLVLNVLILQCCKRTAKDYALLANKVELDSFQ